MGGEELGDVVAVASQALARIDAFGFGIVGVDQGMTFMSADGLHNKVVIKVSSFWIALWAGGLIGSTLPVDLKSVGFVAREGFGFFLIQTKTTASQCVNAFFAAVGLSLKDIENIVFAVAAAVIADAV